MGPIKEPLPGKKFMTPLGKPASLNSFIKKCALYTAEDAGFHIATFPIRAGAVGKLPAMEVKLNGVIANTKPSKGLFSNLFQIPSGE